MKPSRQNELQARVWKHERLDSSRRERASYQTRGKREVPSKDIPLYQQHPGQPRKAMLKASSSLMDSPALASGAQASWHMVAKTKSKP